MKKLIALFLCCLLLVSSAIYASAEDVPTQNVILEDAVEPLCETQEDTEQTGEYASKETDSTEATSQVNADEDDTPAVIPAYCLVIPQFSGIEYLSEKTYIGDLYFCDVQNFTDDIHILLNSAPSRFTSENGSEIPYTLLIEYYDGSTETVDSGSELSIDCCLNGDKILMHGSCEYASAYIVISPEAWLSASGGNYSASITFSAEIVSVSE